MNTDNIKKKFVQGAGIPLRGNDIDTDRIIPARFMKCVTFDGLGHYAFYDSRFDESGNKKEHPFNDDRFKQGSILIVNRNFGCGSSREHAPQSLLKYGISAIIGESFAEIFSGNCISLGIPAVTAKADEIQKLMDEVEQNPDTVITVSIEKLTVSYDHAQKEVEMPSSSQLSLVEGTWDSTSQLMVNKGQSEDMRSKLPYISGY